MPITVLASGADAVDVLGDDGGDLRVLLGRIGLADDAGPGGVEGVLDDRRSSAAALTSSPVRSSTVSVMSVSIRPNDDALVTSRVTPPGS